MIRHPWSRLIGTLQVQLLATGRRQCPRSARRAATQDIPRVASWLAGRSRCEGLCAIANGAICWGRRRITRVRLTCSGMLKLSIAASAGTCTSEALLGFDQAAAPLQNMAGVAKTWFVPLTTIPTL